MNLLKNLALRLILRLRGIRFYETSHVPRSQPMRKGIFTTRNQGPVEFHFYKEFCEDLVYKHGKIRKLRFVGFIVQAQFAETVAPPLRRYNNLKFFFPAEYLKFLNDQQVTEALLRIYLEFIQHELLVPEHEVA